MFPSNSLNPVFLLGNAEKRKVARVEQPPASTAATESAELGGSPNLGETDATRSSGAEGSRGATKPHDAHGAQSSQDVPSQQDNCEL